MNKELPPARLPFPVTRALAEPIRAEGEGDMPTMVGHFATFNDPYEVDSQFEGHFLERIAPGAFDATLTEQKPKVLYDHGQDPQIGNKVLGGIESLGVDEIGPAFEVPLYDTSYNRDLAPGLRDGAYGTSFRFSVEEDTWDQRPKRTTENPDAIPERTITRARVYEFGPVTFPANPNATVGVRSTTDLFYKRSRDPEQFEALVRSAQRARSGGLVTPAAQYVIGERGPELLYAVGDTQLPASKLSAALRSGKGSVDAAMRAVSQAIKSQENKVDEPAKVLSREEQVARVNEIKRELIDIDEEFTGVLPEDVQSRWNGMTAEQKKLEADIEARDTRHKQMAENSNIPQMIESGNAPMQINRKAERDLHSPESKATSFEGIAKEYRDDAMRLVETTHFAAIADQTRSGDRIADLLDNHDSPNKELARRIKYTSAPAYERAFEKLLKSGGQSYVLTPEEQRGTALVVTTDANGGYAVPFAFDPTVIAIGSHSGAINPYRRSCRVVSIVGTDTWNALTATAVTATRTTEAAAAVEQGPTFAQPQYLVTRVQGQITASFEMFQDRTDLASEMAKLIQEAKDNEEESSMATGATAAANIGVGPVSGTSGAYTAVAGAGSGVLAALDFVAVEAALPVRHRFNAQWFSNRANIRKAQAVETTGGQLFGGNQYPAVGNVLSERSGNTGLTLLGYPVNESPSLPTATTTTITAMTLLNTDSYVIVDRIGMSVQFIPFIFNSSALATGQQALYFMYRNTAKPINVDAGRTLRYL